MNSFLLISAGAGQQVTGAADCQTMVTDSAVANTATVIPDECGNDEKGESVNAQWICIIILVVVLALAYVCYKQIKNLMDSIQKCINISKDHDHAINSQKTAIESLRNRLEGLEQNVARSEAKTSVITTSQNEPGNVSMGGTIPSTVMQKSPEPIKKSMSSAVMYASLQAPDANGILRFAERSMTDEVNDKKMFEVEIDTVNGTGTYRVNPHAMSMLMSDLQLLRDFVEPFTTSGNTPAQKIINDKPGKIHHEGKFWIVDELAKIKIV